MTLDTTLRAAAKSLLETYGKSATLTRTSGGTRDSVTGEQTIAPTETVHTVYCSPPKRFRRDQIDGQIIREDDFWTTIAAKDLAITPSRDSDQLTFDDADYTILRVEPLYSGAEIAAFKLHLRV